MSRLTLSIVLVVCLLAIVAAAVDLRCHATPAGPATVVVACRASRLAAVHSH